MASKRIKSSFSQRNIEWRRKTFDLIKKEDEEVVNLSLPLLSDKFYMVYDNNPEVVANNIKSLLQR